MSEFLVAPILPRRAPDRPTLSPLLFTLAVASVLQLALVVPAGLNAPLAPDAGAEGFGFLVGTVIAGALIFGLVPFLVLRWAVLRHSRRDVGGQYLAVLLISAAVISGATTTLVVQPRLEAAHRARELALASAMRGAMRQTLADEAAMAERARDLGLSETLAPGQLARDGHFAVARASVVQLRALIAEERALSTRRGAQVRARLVAIDARTAPSFDAGLRRGVERLDRIDVAMNANLDAVTALLDFLGRSRRHWQAVGNAFMFDNERDLASFRQLQARLIRTNTEVMVLQAQLTELRNRSFDQAEAALPAAEETAAP